MVSSQDARSLGFTTVQAATVRQTMSRRRILVALTGRPMVPSRPPQAFRRRRAFPPLLQAERD